MQPPLVCRTPQRATGPRGGLQTCCLAGEGALAAPRTGTAGKPPRESRQRAAARGAAGKYRRGRRGGEYFPLPWKNAKSSSGPAASLPSLLGLRKGGERRGWPEPLRPPRYAGGAEQDQTRLSGGWKFPSSAAPPLQKSPWPGCICGAPPPPLTLCQPELR